jgi:hypothetical protein
MGFHAPDAAWDLSDLGLGTFDGAAAIRGFVEDWFATWQDLVLETEEIVDLGRVVWCSRPSGKKVARQLAAVTSSSGGDG